MLPPLVAIIGAPNVGKSTLFNRLIGGRRAIVTDEPGVTRDRLYGVVARGPRPFRVVDTGGLAADGSAPFARQVERQAEAALREASLVLLVVDARAGATAVDRELAARLRRRSTPVLLVASKVDTPALEPLIHELYELGLGEPVPVSAEHGLGISRLLEAVDGRLGAGAAGPDRPAGLGARAVRVALVGRPNVGKSSILNCLAGEERAAVSEIPGTTRDTVDTLLQFGDRQYLLVDTAGLRRPSRARLAAERFSVQRARQAIERADVAVVVLDGAVGILSQDTHIAGYVQRARKPLVFVVNKWDLVPDREKAARRWEQDIRDRFRFAPDAPVLLASAGTGRRVRKLLDLVDAVDEACGLRIPTPELNRWLRKVAPLGFGTVPGGRRVRLFYATQTGIRPPRFVLFCNDARSIRFSLRRHLCNSLRESFGFGAAPIELRFRTRRR
jgi:GTP-binding protein